MIRTGRWTSHGGTPDEPRREDRYLLLRDARELINLLDGLGRHDQVAVVRLERLLRARGYDDEANTIG